MVVELKFLPFSEGKFDIQPYLKQNQPKADIT